MLREYRVLEALRETDVPHTRAVAACDDPSVLGACFYLMEFVDGWSPMSTGRTWPAPFDSDLAARRGLATELVEAIARLSRVDWKARGLDGFGKPDGFHERQVDRWLAHLAAFKIRELPGLEVAADWLRRHKPSTYRPGIIHGDYQFANVMYRHGAPARMAAIVDWEMATIGDPLLDLGWVLMGWPDPDEDRTSAGYVDYAGMPSRAELMERYASVPRDQAVVIRVAHDVAGTEPPRVDRPVELDRDERGVDAGHERRLDRRVADVLAAANGERDELERALDARDLARPAEQPHGRAHVDDVGIVERTRERRIARREGAREGRFLEIDLGERDHRYGAYPPAPVAAMGVGRVA
jgi:hypothetical protein